MPKTTKHFDLTCIKAQLILVNIQFNIRSIRSLSILRFIPGKDNNDKVYRSYSDELL